MNSDIRMSRSNMSNDMGMGKNDMGNDMGMGSNDMGMSNVMTMSHHLDSFYFSKNVTILFHDWITKTSLGYTLTLFAIVGFGVFNAYLKTMKERLVHKQNFQLSRREGDTDGKALEMEAGDITFVTVDPIKKCCTCVSYPTTAFFILCLTFMITMFDFCLMLIAMTFEAGVFFSTCLGISIGCILFHFPASLGKSSAGKDSVDDGSQL